ncbi:putative glycosyl hydrolase family 79 C-terminal beta domain [Lyophyllum shimeji]|uniref:Glycosyl hydrolase family 79 C-terminal beta domain n=1 Tax=Lyophyllum shimeji TaxID=47721 RepID=A0A9P3UNZ6_LYOSH|nr:putative glycosyl hydrolase family 79 C-terminal beta domain [Lyophyllum shimeji]
MTFKKYAFLAVGLPHVLGLSSLKLSGPPSLPSTASHALHPALGSFSIETAFFEEFVGNTSVPNTLTKNLLENLKARTGTPAEVRIGGITADSTYWNASQEVSLVNFIDSTGALHNTTIGPGFWESVKLLPEGTKVVMNLDLHDLNYTGALSVAESALKGLPRQQLELFEIGNEPDHYLRFTPQNYSAIWGTWAKNISDTLALKAPTFQVAATVEDPLWPYDAPGASSQLDCVSVLAAGANKQGVVRSCSEHTYQYSVCDPPRTAVATLPNLVNHTRLAMYLDLWQPRIKSVRKQLGPHSFVVGEYNSVSCSGKNNVSNTFGQALWLLDTTLYGASLNISRMYIHQGGPLALQSSTQLNHGGLSFYDLWYPVQNMNGPVKVFPAYSAYLFVAEALGHSESSRIANIYPGRQANGSSITTALGDESEGQLVAYGFWDDKLPSGREYPSKLALLNLQIYNQTQSIPRPSATFDISDYLKNPHRPVTVRRLTAPGADVKEANVTTWAGQNFASGVAAGKFVEERVSGGKITVKASEAVLVTVYCSPTVNCPSYRH